MALKALMIRKKIADTQKELEELRAKSANFATREAELEKAISEASTEEEKQTVETAITEFDAERATNEAKIKELNERVSSLEAELSKVEKKQETPPAEPEERSRKETTEMATLGTASIRARKLFGGMTSEQRSSMFEREDVKAFNASVRSCIAEKRTLGNVGLTIPDVYLGLVRQNIEEYSKLYKHVYVRPLKGTGRMTVMGTIPEAVWTEMCSNLNELSLGFNNVEVDGYKVGGFFSVCDATLEDSEIDLAAEIIVAIGQSIGLALDKAILYGVGTKMPLGIVKRLTQASAPQNYPATARPWADLHTSNVKTVSADLEGVTLFRQILINSAAAKSKYSRGVKTWVMNETTYTTLVAEGMSVNAAGSIVTAVNGTMPIIGGNIEILDFIPDNVIIGGYFDLYLLAERSGTKLSQSEHIRFLADQTVFKGSARYDGIPVIPEAFVAMALNGGTVSADAVTFAEDTANPNAALSKLAGLSISGVTLGTEFSPDTTTYTGTTTTATGTITATPQDGFDAVSITYNGAYVPNGGSVKWASGAGNTVVASVKDSTTGTVTSYQVTVTKS